MALKHFQELWMKTKYTWETILVIWMTKYIYALLITHVAGWMGILGHVTGSIYLHSGEETSSRLCKTMLTLSFLPSYFSPDSYFNSSNDSVNPKHMQEHIVMATVFIPGMAYNKNEKSKERRECMVQALSPKSPGTSFGCLFLPFFNPLAACFSWYPQLAIR